MKNLTLLIIFLFSLSLLGCEKLNEEKAKTAIRNYLNENLDDMSTYEAVKFGTLDTLYNYNGYRIRIYNTNNPFQIVHSKKIERNNQLGFLDDEMDLVIPYDSTRHKLILFKGKILLFDENDEVFYQTSINSAEKIVKNGDSNFLNIESQNKQIIIYKPSANQYEMFHSYRLKNNKGAKYLTKKYFKLNNHFEIIDLKEYSFKFDPYVGVETIAIDTAAADTAAPY